MAQSLEYEDLTDELTKYIEANCSRLPAANMRIEGCALPSVFKEFAQRIIDFDVRPDDIWVLSYPKCGTTWTQEMVWLLVNDCNFETAKKVNLVQRFPFLEFVAIGGPENDDTIERANNMPSPRLIKCHLPINLLPKQIWTKKPKIIYVYRDPRDAAISYYYHMKLWYNYSGSMDKLINGFLDGVLIFDPFWKNILPFWDLRDEPNMCFNTFEDMKKDLGAVIDKTSAFLGIKISESNKVKLMEHLSFSSMKNNESVNYRGDMSTCKHKDLQFIREGKSGGWKTRLSKEQLDKFDDVASKYIKNKTFPLYNMSK